MLGRVDVFVWLHKCADTNNSAILGTLSLNQTLNLTTAFISLFAQHPTVPKVTNRTHSSQQHTTAGGGVTHSIYSADFVVGPTIDNPSSDPTVRDNKHP